MGGRVLPQGPWSATTTFTMFPTVADRMLRAGKVLVATTPTSYDSFVANDDAGNHQGFEIDLINWLVKKTSEKLHIEKSPSVEIVEIPWSRLFQAVERGEVDLAIRSITKSARRERQFRNIHFSRGYLQNHQIIIQRDARGEFSKSLASAIVGVKANSINEKAARNLVKDFHWKVDASYTSYGDIYEAIQAGKLDFAVVDSVLAQKFIKRRLHQFGPRLDAYLQDFYREELGSEIEEYAIAIHESEGDESLRNVINELLTSDIGKQVAAELLKKNGL